MICNLSVVCCILSAKGGKDAVFSYTVFMEVCYEEILASIDEYMKG